MLTYINPGYFLTTDLTDPATACKETNLNTLGGGIQGLQTNQQVGHQDKSITRNILRNAYSSVCNFKPYGLKNNGKTTPFRIITNSGDPNGTVNNNPVNSMPQINQVSSIGANLVLSRISYGGAANDGDSYYSGNPRYVYDSSNYVRYKKEQSINNNYNDSTSGGNYQPNVSMALNRVRH